MNFPGDFIPKDLAGKVRFGPGVVGKSSWIGIFVLLMMMTAIWKTDGNLYVLAVCILGGLGFSVWLICKMFAFAEKFPNIALLEGSELLAWRQMDMASQDMPVLPGGPVIQGPSESGTAP